nr:PREDICTED: zinc finger homeobox protein 3-like [Struthio camelus australis]
MPGLDWLADVRLSWRAKSYKDPAKEPPKQEEQKNAPREVSPLLPKPPEEPEAESKSADSLCDPFIVPKVQYKLVCRKCQAGFSDQEAASNHLKSLCFFGQSVVNLQEMVLHVPTGSGGKGSGSYQCVACESTVCGAPRAPLGKPPPPPFPPLSSSSTVTSSSCSTSGVQPSMPTDDYSEESDTDVSQKSDGPASPVEGPKDPGCPKDSGLTSVGMDTFRL